MCISSSFSVIAVILLLLLITQVDLFLTNNLYNSLGIFSIFVWHISAVVVYAAIRLSGGSLKFYRSDISDSVDSMNNSVGLYFLFLLFRLMPSMSLEAFMTQALLIWSIGDGARSKYICFDL